MIFRISKRIASVEFLPNPFPVSKFKDPVFHGSAGPLFKKFVRPPQGVWFSVEKDYAEDFYSKNDRVIAAYVDVRNPYIPTDQEIRTYFGPSSGTLGDPAYKDISSFFRKLQRKGYDGYLQETGDSVSIAVLGTTPIINAITGESM